MNKQHLGRLLTLLHTMSLDHKIMLHQWLRIRNTILMIKRELSKGV